MNLQHAIPLLQATCALHHTALSTEKSYIRCLRHYARFLRNPQPKTLVTSEEKIEAFLRVIVFDVSPYLARNPSRQARVEQLEPPGPPQLAAREVQGLRPSFQPKHILRGLQWQGEKGCKNNLRIVGEHLRLAINEPAVVKSARAWLEVTNHEQLTPTRDGRVTGW